MARVSVPVQVLLWVEVEDGTDAEVTERAHAEVARAIPGADGSYAAPDGRLFDACLPQVVTYVTVDDDIDLDLIMRWLVPSPSATRTDKERSA